MKTKSVVNTGCHLGKDKIVEALNRNNAVTVDGVIKESQYRQSQLIKWLDDSRVIWNSKPQLKMDIKKEEIYQENILTKYGESGWTQQT